jgi:hypothetical protein
MCYKSESMWQHGKTKWLPRAAHFVTPSSFWHFVMWKLISAILLFSSWPLIGNHLNMLCNKQVIWWTAVLPLLPNLLQHCLSILLADSAETKAGKKGMQATNMKCWKCSFFWHINPGICWILLMLGHFQCNVLQYIGSKQVEYMRHCMK